MRFNADEAPEHMKGLVPEPEEEQDDRPEQAENTRKRPGEGV
jgi:hypothetical protein